MYINLKGCLAMNHDSLDTFKHLHLLYVEDDPLVRNQISEFLRRYFDSLQEASSAEEAMKCFNAHQPDIILLDINLPGKNGLTFASEIRKRDHAPRIIVSTAYTDQDFLLLAVELELTRYLVKPLTKTKLLEALEKAANEHATLHGKKDLIDLGEGFLYHSKQRVLMHQNRELTLRRKELQLLEFFINHDKQIIDYQTLEYSVWSEKSMSNDAIRSQIRNLRKKTHPKIIQNINSIGYRLYQKKQL